MNMKEAQHEYLSLSYRYRMKEITESQFRAGVEQLQVQAVDDSWWRIRDDGLGWLRWNGSAWVPERLPELMRLSLSQESPEEKDAPFRQSLPFNGLGQYCAFLFKQMKASFVKNTLLMAIFLAVVLVVNIYLGMRFQIPWWGRTGEFFYELLGVRAGLLWRFLLWLVLSALVVSIYNRFRRDGAQKFFRDISSIPTLFENAWKKSGQLAPSILLGGGAFAFLICSLANVRLFSLLLFIASLLALSKGTKSNLFLVFGLLRLDLERLVKRDLRSFDYNRAVVLFCGFALGSLVAFFLPLMPQSGYYAFLAMVVLSIVFTVLRIKKNTPTGIKQDSP
jgi:hypothetical protein